MPSFLLSGNEGSLFSLGTAVLGAADGDMSWSDGIVAVLGTLLVVGIILCLLAGPFVIGGFLAKRLRMPDHGWKIGLVLCALINGIVIVSLGWPPKLGIDLSGGTILVYEVDQSKKKTDDAGNPISLGSEGMDLLIGAIARRVNPGGVKEVVIRQYGREQIEIIIPINPEIDTHEAERIEKIISRAGTLEFRILANKNDHPDLINLAQSVPEMAGRTAVTEVIADPKAGKPKTVVRGWWVPLQKAKDDEDYENRVGPLIEDAQAKTISRTVSLREDDSEIQMLVANDVWDVLGGYLKRATSGFDTKTTKPCVNFSFDSTGARLFAGLTEANLPDTVQKFTRRLGIILDGQLYSAPSIQSKIWGDGQITGSFTSEEVKDLVDTLNAGALPTALSDEPISKLQTGPRLGRDTIVKGSYAIAISMSLVLLFMLVYYRFAGMVACLALLMNLVLIMAIMIAIKAYFTLPGIAGLVLTVGMAVDANVLIFERIREEIARGAALRMAIRNGFARATTTIVDANLTTLITATVLFAIGTDQVRGFAVTLWLGVVLSMFTAIFCSRVLFDIAEKKRWITELKMLRILGKTSIDFLGKRRLAGALSALVITVGLVGVVSRGEGLLDIDFTGGVSVEILFNEPVDDISVVRKALGDRLDDFALSDVKLEGDDPLKRFVANSSQKEVDKDRLRELAVAAVGRQVKAAFGDPVGDAKQQDVEAIGKQVARVLQTKAESKKRDEAVQTLENQVADLFADAPEDPKLRPALRVLQHQIDKIVRVKTPIDFVKEIIHDQFPGKLATNSMTFSDPVLVEPGEPSATGEAPQESPEPDATGQTRHDLPDDTVLALADEIPTLLVQPDPAEIGGGADEPTPAAGGLAVDRSRVKLTFTRALDHETLVEMFRDHFESTPHKAVGVTFSNPDYNKGVNKPFEEWDVTIDLPPEEVQSEMTALQAKVADTPYFPASNTIGGKVAGNTRALAVTALVASLLCIVAYIWIRFQRVVFGLAAVIALVHDVLVTLGVIALSAYVADYLGFLMIDEFKIGLPVLAAFLTIIGYSLNDTIVVFDRIREVRGKAPKLTGEMVNISINQTLSRTVLTSLTTLLVVVILYIGGGQGIHAFAFALVIGVIVGTYSSIFVAAPALLWMSGSSMSKSPRDVRSVGRRAP